MNRRHLRGYAQIVHDMNAPTLSLQVCLKSLPPWPSMCAQIIQNIHDAFLDSKRSDLSDLRTAVISAVKEALREEILKNNPYKEPTNLYQLLANGALEEIDWEKLAQALVLLYEDGYFQIEAEISGDEEWEPKRVAG